MYFKSHISISIPTHWLFPTHFYYFCYNLIYPITHPIAETPPLSRDSESQPSHMRSQRYVPDPDGMQGLLQSSYSQRRPRM